MVQRTKLRPVTRANSCELCEGKDKCSRGEDGLIVCGRRQGHVPGFVHLGPSKGDEQFHLYRREDDPEVREREEEYRRPSADDRRRKPAEDTAEHNGSNGDGHGPPPKDLRTQAEHFAGLLTPDPRAELAADLGLPPAALASLPLLGFSADDANGPCWTFPEVDAAGRVVGISRRYKDGRKKAVYGGGRGLTVPAGWLGRPGPVFLPEGQSDTLALTAMGLPAVGRPSNMGGVEELVELLKDFPRDRGIIVLGEMDPKPDGKWPGKDGAVRTAEALAGKLGRPVSWALPPDGAKDTRKWALQQGQDVTCADAWQEMGERFAAELKPQPAGPAEASGFRWEPIDSGTFARNDYRPAWLVKRVLVRGQTAVVGGPRKSLKTSCLVDLAVSLASATPFLGSFDVPAAVRVAIASGESGPFTLQETARRVCAARGLALEDLDNLAWQFRLPMLAKIEDLARLQAGLRDGGVEVLILDPLYLSLLAGQGPGGARAENLFDTGPLLAAITQACLSAGVTPALAHHTRKGSAASVEPLDLDDLAFAGIAEFARQWLLLSRREKYDPGTGQHRLWLSVGGSMGHGGLWSVDVDEGVIGEDFTGRRWNVTVCTATEAWKSERDAKEKKKREEKVARDRADDTALLTALDQLDPHRKGAGENQVRVAASLPKERMSRAVLRLKANKTLRETSVVAEIGSGATRPVKGLVRCADT